MLYSISCWARSRDRFGVVEFALITALNFTTPPEEADIAKHSVRKRIIEEYFEGENMVKCQKLAKVFEN